MSSEEEKVDIQDNIIPYESVSNNTNYNINFDSNLILNNNENDTDNNANDNENINYLKENFISNSSAKNLKCLNEDLNVEAIKMLLYIHDEEPIVEDTGNDSFEELVTKINENRGKIIFLICHGSYVDYRRLLIMRGFKEFVDFMNGLSFMTREQCGYMRPEWSLIRNM